MRLLTVAVESGSFAGRNALAIRSFGQDVASALSQNGQ